MKKIITISTLIVSTFLMSACSDVEYDFSSKDALEASFIKQGEKEGFSKKETLDIWKKYNINLALEKKEEIGAFYLNVLEKKLNNKSLTELINETK